MKSRNMKSLSPNLPEDLAISFYIQSHKLIFAAYQLTNIQGQMKFESCQTECSVQWLNDVLVLFTVSLQLCQQLKDKVRQMRFLRLIEVILNRFAFSDFCVLSIQRFHCWGWRQYFYVGSVLLECNKIIK